MAGRLLYGVGIGFAMHAAPAYIAGALPLPGSPAATCSCCCRRCLSRQLLLPACQRLRHCIVQRGACSGSACLPCCLLLPALLHHSHICHPAMHAIAAPLPPAAAAETSPARVRGLLISLKEAFIVGGILAG